MTREYQGRLPWEWSREEKREVIWELWCAGKSFSQISETVGIRWETVVVRISQMRKERRDAADKGD